MKEKTKYEIDKDKKKEKLVRNEFIYQGRSEGRFEFPIIKKQNIDVNKVKFLSYVNAKINDKENKDKTIHFFTHDWKFEKVYENAEEELEKLSQYYCLLSPDYSIFTNMPIALQILSVFKNRWCGAYWQEKGLNVIPTVSWGDERSFDFCFDGIEEGAIVAVCTYYREDAEKEFMLGYNEMMKRIKPRVVLCYDEAFASMKGNVIEFLPTTYEWTKDLDWKDLVQFKWEKHNKNVCGLNPNDFKYFKYEDPYAKTEIAQCPVCNSVCLTDKFGNGECQNCGWNLCKLEITEDTVCYPNIVSLKKAREQFLQGKKFIPSFDDFIEGLKMYSEMSFQYENKDYGVFYYTNGKVELFQDNVPESLQTYNDVRAFKRYASINGKLLSVIWDDVKNVNYMS